MREEGVRRPSGHSTWLGLRESSGRGTGSNQDQAFAGIPGEENLFAGVIRRMVCESAAILPS